jgi:hypothetical protein
VTVMCHKEKLLEAHSISTTWLSLESFLPPSGRNGKVSRLGEICAASVRCHVSAVPTGCFVTRSNSTE